MKKAPSEVTLHSIGACENLIAHHPCLWHIIQMAYKSSKLLYFL